MRVLPTADWVLSQQPLHCCVCDKDILTGSRTFPQEGAELGSLAWAHLRCAERAALAAGHLSGPVAPLCREGSQCPYRESCIFRHPPLPSRPPLGQPGIAESTPTATAAATAAAAAQVATRRRGKVLKRFRAGTFRRWLLDTYGPEVLSQGSGVLDVAGGRGELAFELLNLHGIPAAVLEPRPLALQRRAQGLLEAGLLVHIGMAVKEQGPRQRRAGERQQRQHQEQQHGPQEGSGEQAAAARGAVGRSSGGMLVPQHLRLVVTTPLTACLLEGLAAGSGDSGAGTNKGVGGPSCPQSSMPASWPALFAGARQEARKSRWASPTWGHGGEGGSAASSSDKRQQRAAGAGRAAESEVVARGTVAGVAMPGRHEAPPLPMFSAAAKGVGNGGGSNPGAATANVPVLALAEPFEVADAEAAWSCIERCSIVVGIHPDEATDFIVDLALAANKPFAVVPCCVHSASFPGRRVAGRPVGSYEDLLDYLVSKDPGHIRLATLPVEGRSRIVYRLP